jgi:hypothetical protein
LRDVSSYANLASRGLDHAEAYFDENDGDMGVASLRAAVHSYDMFPGTCEVLPTNY